MLKDISIIFLSIFFESLPFLLLGSLISSIIETFVSNDTLARIIPKNKVLKSDTLIRKIQYDLDNSNKDYWESKKETEKWANTFLNINKDKNIDYYKLYKEQYIDDLKERLIELRSIRSKEIIMLFNVCYILFIIFICFYSF